MDEVTPRGPNLKLRKRYQQLQNQEEEFDKLTTTTPKRKRRKIVEDDTDEENDMENEGLEDLDMSAEE